MNQQEPVRRPARELMPGDVITHQGHPATVGLVAPYDPRTARITFTDGRTCLCSDNSPFEVHAGPSAATVEPAPAAPKPRRRWGWAVAATVLAFLIGIGAGQAGTAAVTEAVTEEVTPQSCLDALAYADNLNSGFQFLLDWIERYLTATGDLDVSAMEVLNGELTTEYEQPRYQGVVPAYEQAAGACRAGAGR